MCARDGYVSKSGRTDGNSGGRAGALGAAIVARVAGFDNVVTLDAGGTFSAACAAPLRLRHRPAVAALAPRCGSFRGGTEIEIRGARLVPPRPRHGV